MRRGDVRTARPRLSTRELIERRRRAGCAGRYGVRAAFRATNPELPPEDVRHRFLSHAHGNAGVGKTFLVREWAQRARFARGRRADRR